MLRPLVTVDFETDAIEGRPKYPPKPVGVAIHKANKRPVYMSWGHPTGNNCTKEDARRTLQQLWRDAASHKIQLVFHHAKFDLDVAEEHFKLKLPPWDCWHDTLFLAFLDDPHAKELSLKPLAEVLLKLKPIERDQVREWILEHVPEAKGKQKNWRGWGAYISRAPGDLVGKYAIGDVVRTIGVFEKLYKRVVSKADMGDAYDRERKLLPILLESERRGIAVDKRKLDKYSRVYTAALEESDNIIRKRLKSPSLNVDANEELADALDRRGLAKNDWLLTDKGNRSTSKDSIKAALTDKKMIELLAYRSTLATCVRTFIAPWKLVSDASGGLIFTSWNQVRQANERTRGLKGARTGRLSSEPNFQNIPNPFEDEEGILLTPPPGLPQLPLLRSILIPRKGHMWLHRDYNQQELRIMGHFEDGVLREAYNKDPRLDMHTLAQRLINELLNTNYKRKPIKNTGFGIIYGMGLGLLAERIDSDTKTADKLRKAYLTIFPGLKKLDEDLKMCGKENKPIRTWGGRVYYCEEPKYIDNRWRTFEYKLLNVLIQGSAADCTKEAIIRYDDRTRDGNLLLTVHDENNNEAPEGVWQREMKIMRETMESVEFDVPMLSDGAYSLKSWADIKDIKSEKR